RITRRLPFELVLAFEQGEDLVALRPPVRDEEDPKETAAIYRRRASRDIPLGIGIWAVAGLVGMFTRLASGPLVVRFVLAVLGLVGFWLVVRAIYGLVRAAKLDRLVPTRHDSEDRAENVDADRRRATAGRLLDVLGRTSARVKTVVTVRTEFFAQVQD